MSNSKYIFLVLCLWRTLGVYAFDYLDLTSDNSGWARCYSGTTDSLYQYAGQVDYGEADERSLHTVQYIPGRTDPRTGGVLPTIPEGEDYAIRLGGFWDRTGNVSSTIEYDYTVPPGTGDLLQLRYAAVLEYAPEHTEQQEARFRLEVLSEGELLDSCVYGDFRAGFGDTQHWHTCMYQEDRPILFCDWQTVALSLKPYIGQTITIRLTSYSCTQTIHIGYAYFTLNFLSADLQGIGCSDYELSHFSAPSGFRYRWYPADDSSRVLSDSSTLYVSPTDTAIYRCDLISLADSTCRYTLTANPNPRRPVAQATCRVLPDECYNRVAFSNTSYVLRTNRLTSRTYTDLSEPISSVRWIFGDGAVDSVSIDSVTHDYPATGGKYTARLVVGMSAHACTDTLLIPISLPALSSHAYDTTYYETLCYGETYRWPADGQVYGPTTPIDETMRYTYTHRLTGVGGCDSTMHLCLTVYPQPAMRTRVLTPAVCPEDPLLNLEVQPLDSRVEYLSIHFPKSLIAQGLPVVYDLYPSFSSSYRDTFFLTLPSTLRPDYYTVYLTYSSINCTTPSTTLHFTSLYPSSIIADKHSFLAVLNSEYNGGYQFAAYQWYRDGVLLPGETRSYLTIDATSPTGADYGHRFYVLLTRVGETLAIPSCEVEAGLSSDVSPVADVEPAAAEQTTKLWQDGHLYIRYRGILYTPLGTEVK